MGRINEIVTIKNYFDIDKCTDGLIFADAVRSVLISALVDTGAAFLCLPSDTVNGQVKRIVFTGAVIFVVDLKSQKLIANPAHNGQWITDWLVTI